mmetsp:Transcript_2866/g.11516  ORF Transcript_2866/g.11516 Transcript_2866/m.11516 type:complete len:209 (+) Transcript_2866:6525-7151(+)
MQPRVRAERGTWRALSRAAASFCQRCTRPSSTSKSGAWLARRPLASVRDRPGASRRPRAFSETSSRAFLCHSPRMNPGASRCAPWWLRRATVCPGGEMPSCACSGRYSLRAHTHGRAVTLRRWQSCWGRRAAARAAIEVPPDGPQAVMRVAATAPTSPVFLKICECSCLSMRHSMSPLACSTRSGGRRESRHRLQSLQRPRSAQHPRR